VVVKKNQSALLAKYFSMYKKNPRSKVFAPLAESFRKLGMLDDSFRILKEGIRNHPNYTLGFIVLAHCYYDQQKYDLTYSTLRPIIGQNADNISLQKIFAQACIHLGYLEEALDTYKYLLFMSPMDKFFAEQVKKLEDDLMVGHKKLSLSQLIKAPDMPESIQTEASDDDWIQVNFNAKDESTNLEEPISTQAAENQWVMKKTGFSEHPILNNTEIEKRDLEDEYYADEFENDYGNIEDVNAQSVSLETPLVSHTLIDLYCAQEYFEKAIELLEKIIELNPDDTASINKLKQVKELSNQNKPGLKVVSEQDGHDELISIIETQVKSRSPSELQVEAKYNRFLGALKERAKEQQKL
jgi:tetratricopeptide (TPR) repeat protein